MQHGSTGFGNSKHCRNAGCPLTCRGQRSLEVELIAREVLRANVCPFLHVFRALLLATKPEQQLHRAAAATSSRANCIHDGGSITKCSKKSDR
eukprot:20088-Heterococcus_DN1.PRE.2